VQRAVRQRAAHLSSAVSEPPLHFVLCDDDTRLAEVTTQPTEDVIGVIRRIGREQGVAAGRTSDRLRSPTNAPKAWAAPLVKANAGRRTRDVEGFAVDLRRSSRRTATDRASARVRVVPWTCG
jgi:hypothetical protein